MWLGRARHTLGLAALLCFLFAAGGGAQEEPEQPSEAKCPAPPVCDCTAEAEQAAKQLKKVEGDLEAARTDLQKAKAEAEKVKAELQKARASLAELEKEPEKRQQCEKQLSESTQSLKAGKEFSALGLFKRSGSLSWDLAQHGLAQTDVDDQAIAYLGTVQDLASTHLGTARALAGDVADKIVSANYSEIVETVKGHKLYVVNVAPTMEAVSRGAEPYMKEYVQPAFSAGMVVAEPVIKAAEPALKMAKDVYDATCERVAADVLPVLKQSAGGIASSAIQEVPRAAALVDAKVGDVMDPVFAVIAKAAPAHGDFLPKLGTDRVLFLLFALLATLIIIRLSRSTVRIALRVMRVALSLTIRLAIKLPLRIVFGVLGWGLWLGTCFGCCCLCSRRRGRKASAHSNGVSNGKLQVATVDETVLLVEAIKKKGNLGEKAVKILKDKADKRQPMEGKNYPQCLQGKILDSKALKEALIKCKAGVDLKPFGM